MSEIKKLSIIGGGAAGFFSAISAAEHNKNLDITIYESSKEVLSKVLISGGGRCNVTNYTLDNKELVKNYPRGQKELIGAFNRFNVSDTINFFENNNVKLKTEADLRMFPISDCSKTIADCLINKAKKLDVEISLNTKLVKIVKNNNKFELYFWNKAKEEVDYVIFTTGGSKASYELIKSLGHHIVDPVPSLFSFEINDFRLQELAGISFQNCKLKLVCQDKKFEQQGSVLITHWGLSGPAIIKLSALAARSLFNTNYQAALIINFLGDISLETAIEIFLKQKTNNPNRNIKSDCPFNLAKSFWIKILEHLEIKSDSIWQVVSTKQVRKLATELVQANFKVEAKGKFKDEFVTCGGVSLKEVDFKTMQSKICPGVYFAGEVLDIDGLTGGFNFQNAWTTGYLAGKSIESDC